MGLTSATLRSLRAEHMWYRSALSISDFRKNAGDRPMPRRLRPVAVAVVWVSALAAVDAMSGPHVVLSGLLAVGPGLAAVPGRPRAVLAVGAYASALIAVLSWWPDKMSGTVQEFLYLAATAMVTVVGFALARGVEAPILAARANGRWRAIAAAVEQSDDAIVAATLGGSITGWNLGASRLYGYSADEMVGSSVSSFHARVMPSDAAGPSGAEVIARIAGGEQGIRYDTRRTHRDGSIKDVAMTVSPILDERGSVAGVSSICRDVSAMKRAEANQRGAEERSQHAQRMSSIGQLAGGVAHDFNNLLGIILNFTGFAAERAAENGADDIEADLAQVRLAAERAVALTSQLLTFSRSDTVRPQLLDINVSIEEVRAMLARTIGEHIELIAAPSALPLMIYADAGHIQQILMNLAVNARDAMPDGGTLLIEATAADLDEHQMRLHPAPAGGRYVRLLVSDTGIGMSADVAAHIFEPFYTTKPKGQGTGLGLATVYGIVAEAGGSINVYSEPEVGTTFRVYFPVIDELDGSTVAAPPAASAPRGQGQTVLVVEDEPALGHSVARILGGSGYQVLSADGGHEALALDAATRCDLLITDLVMPGISGRRLVELLHERRPGLPVLYMSGYTTGLLGTTRILDQDIAFIEKPFTAHLLLSEVNNAFVAAAARPEQ